MGCDCARAVPRWILSTLNFTVLTLSLCLLFLAVLLTLVPGQVIAITDWLIHREWLTVSHSVASFISSLLVPQLLQECGRVLLGLSILLLLPSSLGYVGAVRESRLLLIAYFSPILILWGVQLAVLILLPVIQTSLHRLVSWSATASLGSYQGGAGELNLATLGWNHAMAQLSCCGVSNYTDFSSLRVFQETKLNLQVVPPGCCILDPSQYPTVLQPQHSQCVFVPTNYNSYFTQGCLSRLGQLASSHVSSVILVVILLLSLEMVVVILAVCLCLLQRDRGDKRMQQVVVVREERQQPRSCCHEEDMVPRHQHRHL